MINISPLNQVVQNLENNKNLNRIKKLLLLACRNTWESDQAKLDQLNLAELIPELLDFNPTLKHLKFTLFNVVKSLNKKDEYLIVANSLINEITNLYSDQEEQVYVKIPSPPVPAIAIADEPTTEPPNHASLTQRTQSVVIPYDQFDVRLEIMNYTNPLRAKILLFSAINNHLDAPDWSRLRSHDLGELLNKIFSLCETVNALESKLYNTAKSLQFADENSQTARVIMQTLSPFYSQRNPLAQKFNRPVNETTQINHIGFHEDQEETCQFLPSGF